MSLAVLRTDQTVDTPGINFPATQVPSAGVNTLDDYEEGSWTPVIGGDGGQSGQSYTQQAGTYTKIGRLVVVNFDVTLSTKGTITGNVVLRGLPFTSGGNHQGGYISFWSALNVSVYSIPAFVSGGQTYIVLSKMTAAVASCVTMATGDLTNTSRLIGGAAYSV